MTAKITTQYAPAAQAEAPHSEAAPAFDDLHWDIVLRSRGGGRVDLRTVWRHRDLTWMFFKRDFTAFYKQTVLGPLWYLIQPLLTSLTYYFVFGKIANLSTSGIPPFLFYMSGIILWGYFSSCLTNNAETFSKNAALFSKVYFPRLVVPFSVAISALVALCIQLLLLLIAVAGFVLGGVQLNLANASLLLLPLLILYVAVLGISVGLIVSAMTVRYRDLAFATGFATQLWMYASPVVYPFSAIPEKYHWVYFLNPMTAPLTAMRSALFGTPAASASLWLANICVTLGLFVLGLRVFGRAEANAMDTV